MRLIAMVGRAGIRVVKVLVLLLPRRIAASTAVTAALEAAEATATTRHATAAATNDTYNDAEDDETSNHDNSNHRPLAKAGSHAVVPAR